MDYDIFIDDWTRKVWVYFSKNKYELFNTFKKKKSGMENEKGMQIKCLRLDNWGE